MSIISSQGSQPKTNKRDKSYDKVLAQKMHSLTQNLKKVSQTKQILQQSFHQSRYTYSELQKMYNNLFYRYKSSLTKITQLQQQIVHQTQTKQLLTKENQQLLSYFSQNGLNLTDIQQSIAALKVVREKYENEKGNLLREQQINKELVKIVQECLQKIQQGSEYKRMMTQGRYIREQQDQGWELIGRVRGFLQFIVNDKDELMTVSRRSHIDYPEIDSVKQIKSSQEYNYQIIDPMELMLPQLKQNTQKDQEAYKSQKLKNPYVSQLLQRISQRSKQELSERSGLSSSIRKSTSQIKWQNHSDVRQYDMRLEDTRKSNSSTRNDKVHTPHIQNSKPQHLYETLMSIQKKFGQLEQSTADQLSQSKKQKYILTQQVNQLEEIVIRLKEDILEMESEIHQKNDNIAKLMQQLDEINTNYINVEQKLKLKQSQIIEIKTQIQLQKDISRQARSQTQQKMKQIQQKDKMILELNQKMNKIKNQKSQLNQQIKLLSKNYQSSQNKQNQITKIWTSKLDSWKRVAFDNQRLNKQFFSEITLLKKQIDTIKIEKINQVKVTQDLRKTNKQLSDDLIKLRNTHVSAQQKSKIMIQQIRKLKEQNLNISQKTKGLLQIKVQLQNLNKKLQQRVKNLIVQNQKMINQQNILKMQIEKYKNQCQKLSQIQRNSGNSESGNESFQSINLSRQQKDQQLLDKIDKDQQIKDLKQRQVYYSKLINEKDLKIQELNEQMQKWKKSVQKESIKLQRQCQKQQKQQSLQKQQKLRQNKEVIKLSKQVQKLSKQIQKLSKQIYKLDSQVQRLGKIQISLRNQLSRSNQKHNKYEEQIQLLKQSLQQYKYQKQQQISNLQQIINEKIQLFENKLIEQQNNYQQQIIKLSKIVTQLEQDNQKLNNNNQKLNNNNQKLIKNIKLLQENINVQKQNNYVLQSQIKKINAQLFDKQLNHQSSNHYQYNEKKQQSNNQLQSQITHLQQININDNHQKQSMNQKIFILETNLIEKDKQIQSLASTLQKLKLELQKATFSYQSTLKAIQANKNQQINSTQNNMKNIQSHYINQIQSIRNQYQKQINTLRQEYESLQRVHQAQQGTFNEAIQQIKQRHMNQINTIYLSAQQKITSLKQLNKKARSKLIQQQQKIKTHQYNIGQFTHLLNQKDLVVQQLIQKIHIKDQEIQKLLKGSQKVKEINQIQKTYEKLQIQLNKKIQLLQKQLVSTQQKHSRGQTALTKVIDQIRDQNAFLKKQNQDLSKALQRQTKISKQKMKFISFQCKKQKLQIHTLIVTYKLIPEVNWGTRIQSSINSANQPIKSFDQRYFNMSKNNVPTKTIIKSKNQNQQKNDGPYVKRNESIVIKPLQRIINGTQQNNCLFSSFNPNQQEQIFEPILMRSSQVPLKNTDQKRKITESNLVEQPKNPYPLSMKQNKMIKNSSKQSIPQKDIDDDCFNDFFMIKNKSQKESFTNQRESNGFEHYKLKQTPSQQIQVPQSCQILPRKQSNASQNSCEYPNISSTYKASQSVYAQSQIKSRQIPSITSIKRSTQVRMLEQTIRRKKQQNQMLLKQIKLKNCRN